VARASAPPFNTSAIGVSPVDAPGKPWLLDMLAIALIAFPDSSNKSSFRTHSPRPPSAPTEAVFPCFSKANSKIEPTNFHQAFSTSPTSSSGAMAVGPLMSSKSSARSCTLFKIRIEISGGGDAYNQGHGRGLWSGFGVWLWKCGMPRSQGPSWHSSRGSVDALRSGSRFALRMTSIANILVPPGVRGFLGYSP